ncbi:MAG: hypothetical protein C4317_03820 [Acidimicrobiia bacterium]
MEDLGNREEESQLSGTGSRTRYESIVPIVIGALLVIGLGWALAVAGPSSDPSYKTPSSVAEQRKSAAIAGTPENRGRKIYISQGCYSCHTQQVRPILTDAYLGPASTAGDYAYDDPVALGYQRIGPDLSQVGVREIAKNRNDLADYLRNPRKDRPWSTMPSFAHLSDEEMADLVAYLQSLK